MNPATPPPTVTTSAPDDVYNASELSLVINKADSIEEKDESESRESDQGSVFQRKTFSSDDIVIEEDVQLSSESVEIRQRKISVVTMGTRKSFEVIESLQRQQSQPIEATILPPTSTSTQTVPTEEFPEVSVTTAVINTADDVEEIAQLNVETQQDMKIAQEIDTKVNETRNLCSQNETNEELAIAEESAKSRSINRSYEEQLQKQSLLAHQQSMSQEEDYEVAMVSGLLPGCVAPAPTPAPLIAPLAEIEADPTEEETDNPIELSDVVEPKPEVERKKKRREKKEREGGESQSHTQAEADSSTDPEKSKHNAVCPWEDE